jgi:hypothetical protein
LLGRRRCARTIAFELDEPEAFVAQLVA